jgi:SAM-dependent methyltransferase
MSKRLVFTEYLDFMSTEYFYVCKDQSVLEIGPLDGTHTRLIASHAPKYFELIEPDSEFIPFLKKYSHNVINDDAFFVIPTLNKFDVVVCCGVLYHLHSPLHLLEIISNFCDPNWIILDCVACYEILCNIEEDNLKGNRQLKPNWKSAGCNITIPFDIIEKSMYNMGYKLVKLDKWDQIEDFDSKSHFWAGLWRKM